VGAVVQLVPHRESTLKSRLINAIYDRPRGPRNKISTRCAVNSILVMEQLQPEERKRERERERERENIYLLNLVDLFH